MSDKKPAERRYHFRYHEFYDIPRVILIRMGERILRLESPFHEVDDEYADTYTASITGVGNALDDAYWVQRGDLNWSALGAMRTGEFRFDRTRQRFLVSPALDVMIYKEVDDVSDAEFRKAVETGGEYAIGNAILGWVLSSPDRLRSEDICAEYASSPSLNVRRTVASCLDHIARIHRALDMERMTPILTTLKLDPEVAGYAECVEDDIDVFIRRLHRQEDAIEE